MELGYFFNKYHGYTFTLSSSTIFNPIHSKAVKAGIGIGAGYMNTGFSDGGWVQQEDGKWINTANRRGNLFVPADLHVQVKAFENDQLILSPVLAYQVSALLNYSHAATIVPQSFIKAGINLSLK